jgi:hypothetical protein
MIGAVLGGRAAAEAAEGIGSRGTAVRGVSIAPIAVGLPSFDQRVRQHIAFPIKDAALDADVGAGQARIGDGRAEDFGRAECALREAEMQIRPDGLGRSALRHALVLGEYYFLWITCRCLAVIVILADALPLARK